MSYRQINKLRQLRQRLTDIDDKESNKASSSVSISAAAGIDTDDDHDRTHSSLNLNTTRPLSSVFLEAANLSCDSDQEESISSLESSTSHNDISSSDSISSKNNKESNERTMNIEEENVDDALFSFHPTHNYTIQDQGLQEVFTNALICTNPLHFDTSMGTTTTTTTHNTNIRGRQNNSSTLIRRKLWLLPSATQNQWKRATNEETLIMEEHIINMNEESSIQFYITKDSISQRIVERQFKETLEISLDVLPDMFRKYPFHLESNFFWTLNMIAQKREPEAYESIRRAIHALQCSFHPRFTPFLSDVGSISPPRVRLDQDSPALSLFLSTLFIYARLLTQFGVHKTALEVYKLIIGCQGSTYDLTHSLLRIDFCCCRTQKIEFLHILGPSLFPEPLSLPKSDHSLLVNNKQDVIQSLDYFLPNFAFAAPFVRALKFVGKGLDILFLNNPTAFQIDSHQFCQLLGTPCSNPSKYIKIITTYNQDGIPPTDQLTAQLLLMRALIMYPQFLKLLCRQLQLSLTTYPRNSRSKLSWNTLIWSDAFSIQEGQYKNLRKYNWEVTRIENNLLKCSVMQSAKLWEPPDLLKWVHECASLLYKQYYYEDDDEWRLQYRKNISDFRVLWFMYVIEFYNKNKIIAKYEDAELLSFDNHQIVLPKGLRLLLAPNYTALLSHTDQKRLQMFKHPYHWISLQSNPFIIFFQSLLPDSAIDRKGMYSTPITLYNMMPLWISMYVLKGLGNLYTHVSMWCKKKKKKKTD